MPRFLRSRRTWLFVVVVLAVAGVATAIGRGSAPKAASNDKPTPTLEFAASDLTAISQRPIARSLAISGSLVAVNQAVVKAKVAVEVRNILIREGDRVSAGQVIARLDTVDLATRLDQQLGARDAMRAQYEIAEKNRTTNASLLEKKFISQNAFDNVASLSSANRAQLDAADAQVRLAQKALKDATVVSPIDGHRGAEERAESARRRRSTRRCSTSSTSTRSRCRRSFRPVKSPRSTRACARRCRSTACRSAASRRP